MFDMYGMRYNILEKSADIHGLDWTPGAGQFSVPSHFPNH
jgi:hypothetical protein